MEEVKPEGTSFLVKMQWILLGLCLVIILFLLAALKQSREHPSYIHPIDTRDEYPVAVLSAEPPPGILPPQEYGLIQPDPPPPPPPKEEAKAPPPPPLPPLPPREVVQEKNFEPQFITKALIASCGGRLCVRVDTSEPPRGQDKDFYIIREP